MWKESDTAEWTSIIYRKFTIFLPKSSAVQNSAKNFYVILHPTEKCTANLSIYTTRKNFSKQTVQKSTESPLPINLRIFLWSIFLKNPSHPFRTVVYTHITKNHENLGSLLFKKIANQQSQKPVSTLPCSVRFSTRESNRDEFQSS